MISLSNISLRRGKKLLFESVSLKLHGTDRIGIVGDNGSGKSSLFSLLLGEIGADTGDYHLPSGALVSHVAQETPASTQSALDYVLDGDGAFRQLQQRIVEAEANDAGGELAEAYAEMEHIDGYGAPSRAARLLHGLGFEPQQQIAETRSFSGGWRVRLNLARALMSPSDILLLDEPTNHLDLDAVVWLEDWLSSYQGTLLLISHDRDFLDGICNRVLHISHYRIKSYSGNYSRFEKLLADSIALEQASYAKQQRAIAHMEDFVRRFRAKATKARQAQSRIKALERMQTIAPAHINSPFRFSFIEPVAASDPLLKAEEMSVGYKDAVILSNIKLSIGSRDRIALVGPNGAGKSTLIKLLAGEIKSSGGELTSAKHLNIGYFAQHQLEQLNPEATPLTQLSSEFPREIPQDLRNFLGGFGFQGDKVNEKIAPFSGGEKARLALALLIYRKPNLLLMDEPTNHLDIEMRHALTMAFQQYSGAIVLVSHDRHLIRTVTDTLWLVQGGEVSPFEEDIDGYMQWSRNQKRKGQESDSPQERTSDSAVIPANTLSRKEKRQQAAKLRQQVQPLSKALKSCEREIDKLQIKSQELEKILSDPAIYESESTSRLADLMQEKAGKDKQISKLENQWLTLSEELEVLEKTLASV